MYYDYIKRWVSVENRSRKLTYAHDLFKPKQRKDFTCSLLAETKEFWLK